MGEFIMALIRCPECGREISDKAASCPGCGAVVGKKFCRHCGDRIDTDCVICPKCGKQVKEIGGNDRNIIINNSSSASAAASASASANMRPAVYGRPKNKWVALLLCIFTICGHKFYEGKAGMGILYLCTLGLFGIGWIIDIITLSMKPNPYYV